MDKFLQVDLSNIVLPGRSCLVISDAKYWAYNEQKIIEWLDRCTPYWSVAGMILSFANEADRCTFLLCWG